MRYNDKEIEIISRKKVFGKTIVQIRILSSGEILDVPESGLQESESEIPASQIAFHAMAARIRNEIATQKVLAPFESSIIPLPHQILALEKVMSGQFIRFQKNIRFAWAGSDHQVCAGKHLFCGCGWTGQ